MSTEVKSRIEVTTPGCKAKFDDWIKNRGGVLVWTSQMIGDNSGQTFTPARLPSSPAGGVRGEPTPHWKFNGCVPELVTDLARFRFAGESKEVKRIKIAARMSGNGLSLKLTDASSRRLRAACDKIQEQNNGVAPTYHFEDKEAVISLPVFEE